MPKIRLCGCSNATRTERGTRLDNGVEVCDYCSKIYPASYFLDKDTADWAQAKMDLRRSYDKPKTTSKVSVGDIILKIWIGIIAACGVIVLMINILSPSDSNPSDKTPPCFIVDNPADPGGAYDSCEP